MFDIAGRAAGFIPKAQAGRRFVGRGRGGGIAAGIGWLK